MRTSSYKRGGAFILTLVLMFTTLFGGLGSLGINGLVEEAYADASPRTTTLDLTDMETTNHAIDEGWAWNQGESILTLSGINLSTPSPTGIILPTSASIVLAEG